MKRLLPILLLLITITATAQNYSCFQPDTIQYYTNSNGYVRGIRIDSVHTEGNDVIFFPFKTVRGYYESMMVPLDSNGGSWLGSKVIQQADGQTLFDNYWGDTVLVKTQATLGDQWIFYHHSSSPYFYRANVIALDTMSFLGYTDSVKKIRVTSFNQLNINYADSLNGFEIILSKNHGFVQTFDLYMFPYHPHDSSYTNGRDLFTDHIVQSEYPFPSIPRKANSIFTLSDYNFISSYQQQQWNVGDVYEYSSYPMRDIFSYFPPNYQLDTINQVNIVGNSTEYISSGWYASLGMNMGQFVHNISYHSNTLYANNCYLCPHVYASPMPEEKWQRLFWYYFPNSTSYCMNTPLYKFYSTRIMYESMTVNTFEPDGFIAEYKGGLGTAYAKYTIGGSTSYSERTLIYYKRGNSTCGSVYVPVSVDDVHSSLVVGVFPNPALDILYIEAPVSGYDVVILNTLGQEVWINAHCNSKHSVDISSLPNGMYYVQLLLKDQAPITRKISVQH